MAKCKILMQTAQVQKLVTFFDGYKDDKVELKYVAKLVLRLLLNVKQNYHQKMLLHIVSLYSKRLQKEVICTSQSSLTVSLDKMHFKAQVNSCAFFV